MQAGYNFHQATDVQEHQAYSVAAAAAVVVGSLAMFEGEAMQRNRSTIGFADDSCSVVVVHQARSRMDRTEYWSEIEDASVAAAIVELAEEEGLVRPRRCQSVHH